MSLEELSEESIGDGIHNQVFLCAHGPSCRYVNIRMVR